MDYLIIIPKLRYDKFIITNLPKITIMPIKSFITVADPGFSPGGAPTPKSAIIFQFFAENCMKMKEFEPPGGGRPWRPPLDPPMH